MWGRGRSRSAGQAGSCKWRQLGCHTIQPSLAHLIAHLTNVQNVAGQAQAGGSRWSVAGRCPTHRAMARPSLAQVYCTMMAVRQQGQSSQTCTTPHILPIPHVMGAVCALHQQPRPQARGRALPTGGTMARGKGHALGSFVLPFLGMQDLQPLPFVLAEATIRM